eukprot:jgi/Phyca11/8013/fgenesh1_pm.PHYCAscaffold_24_\
MSRASLAHSISSFPCADIFHDSDSDDSDSDVDELFNTEDFVTVAEDLLLVKLRCFHPKLDVTGLSAAFQREFSVVRDSQELENRLQKLQAPEFRALLVLYLKAVSIAQESHTRTSCETRLFQMMYDLDKSQQEAASEMLLVELSGRNFPKYTRSVSKAELRRCCKGIDDLFRRQVEGETTASQQAFTLYAARTANEKLLITDAAPRYESCAVFNHFEQPIFDRLVLFSKDPDLVERLRLQKQQQAEAGRIKQQFGHQLRSIFEKLQQKQAQRLEQMQAQEFEMIKTQLEKNLEADLQHIRQMHAALLNHERAKINAKYEEQRTVLNEKVKSMQRDALALQKKCDSSGWHGLERMIMTTSLQVERIFGTSEYLLRLLILAEDMNADPLRRALVRYISEEDRLLQFILRRELTSKMIAETTVLAILKESTTKDLREVASYGASFIHQDLVTRELHTRQVEFGRFLAGLTNDQLRAARRYTVAKKNTVQASYLPDNQTDLVTGEDVALDAQFDRFASALEAFPDILSREFTRRREFSCVKMDSTDIEQFVSFAAEDCVLQLEASHRYCTVHATKERRQGESGKWMFEVTVDIFGGDGEITNPAYRLVPVVSMYSSSKKPQMRVTFNFRGDFKFPITGFDPFGAPL